MIDQISQRNTYSGNKISESIMKMFAIEITELHDGILVPYWLGVLEKGRGPRKSTTDSGLWKKIYAWMEKHNMFRSATNEGKVREAKFITWHINKYGNQQFRSRVFVDIFTSVRNQAIEMINKKASDYINKITMEVI